MTSGLTFPAPLAAPVSERGRFLATAAGGAFGAAALALLWQSEEPSKLRSVVVAMLVWTLGMVALSLARRWGIVTRCGPWAVVFLLKIALSWFITQYLWVAPLEPDLLRSPYQNVALQDANTYDYVGVRLAQEGFAGNLSLLSYTWLSFGVIGYLGLIYSLFGVSVLYVSLFNALLNLVGILCLTGVLTLLDRSRRRWQALRWAMLLPYGAYYDATPSKEPLTQTLFYAGLLITARLLERKGSAWLNVAALAAVAGLLSAVRVNVAVLLLAANLVFFYRRLGGVRSTLLAITGALIFLTALAVTNPQPEMVATKLFSLDVRLAHAQTLFVERTSAGDSPLKLIVGNALTPHTMLDLIVLSPVRLLVWIFLPYPALLPDFARLASMPEMLLYDRRGYFRFASEVPAQLSAILMVLLAPYLAAGLRVTGSRWHTAFLAWNFILPAAVISNLMLIMGRRYRTLLEPLLLAIALWGMHYGRHRRLRYVMYPALAAGLVAAAAIQATLSR